jgi:hypothetical protein
MIDERKFEQFETEDKKWEVLFDLEDEKGRGHAEKIVMVRFRLIEDERNYLTSRDIANLKQDLIDLGKFRIIKQGREFLNDE